MAENKNLQGVSKVTSFAVDPRIMEVEEGFNARPLDLDRVASIAQAYRNGATLPALDVRVDGGRIIVVDGHHRRQGALDAIAAGAEILALDCRQFRGNDADRVAHMITSASGLPLTPLQLGRQYRKLIGFGWTEKAIADRVGKSTQHIKDMLALTESNSDVQAAVDAGKVSASNALKIYKTHGQKAGAVIAEHVHTAQLAGKQKATSKQIEGNTPKNLPEAIRAEMNSGGTFRAEALCPKYADLIAYLRGSAAAV
jgi:ParB-like chromosome segregation protein Spo0J